MYDFDWYIQKTRTDASFEQMWDILMKKIIAMQLLQAKIKVVLIAAEKAVITAAVLRGCPL